MLRSRNGSGRSMRQTSGPSCSMSGKVGPRDQIEETESAGAQQTVVRFEDHTCAGTWPLRREQPRRQVRVDEREAAEIVRQREARDERVGIREFALALQRCVSFVQRLVVPDERIVALRDFLEIPTLADEIGLLS